MADEYIRLDTTIITIDKLISEAATGSIVRALFNAKDVIYRQQRYVIDVQPDVQPIVYAHKTINVGMRSYCSNCGKLAVMEDFCSKCGAKVESKCGAKVEDGDTE